MIATLEETFSLEDNIVASDDNNLMINPENTTKPDLEKHNNRVSLTGFTKSYRLFFLSAGKIYSNWQKGKEHEEYHIKLATRLPELKSIVGKLPQSIGQQLQTLALSVKASRRDDDEVTGQDLLMELVKAGKYDDQRIQTELFYAYAIENDLDKLIADLNQAGKDANEEQSKKIDNLIQEVKREYRSQPERE